ILAGGGFTTIGGQPRNCIARLDATTGLADSFDPNANHRVNSIAVQADGKILAGGLFGGIGGQPRNCIARLDATTGLADSFNPNANNEVESIAVQADGKILAGGLFTTIGGQPRSLFARLSNDSAALQNLAVTQTTITWTLGGSSPQFTRVTFEYSTDNVTYTPLGNGAATGSNWTLTGLNLPTGQNFYVRARGYYPSSYLNGSESVTESVRNAFLNEAPLLTSAFSRKTHGAAGTFDVPLPLSGNVGIECRSGGATNDYQMIINFATTVTVGSASVTSGSGSVSSFSVSGSQVTVNLTGVTNVQTITVTLFNVNDGTHMGDVPVSMGVLVGDVNGNAVVNASDVSLTKSQVGQAVSGSNFREDVNANGLINSVDVAQVKAKVGTALPP
ncbi:MAG: dockerin type I domain-containing protein, partial [Chthoniobacterales bacterium]